MVSFSPATTCALVTTRPGLAIHPEPSMPSPHAVPRSLTTLSPARFTSGSLAIARSGARTFAFGPLTWGVGSICRTRLRSGPEGGRALFSADRIRELCSASRRSRSPGPGTLSAAAPKAQASSRPKAASSAAPPIPSSRAASPPRGNRALSARAKPSIAIANVAPSSSPATTVISGA